MVVTKCTVYVNRMCTWFFPFKMSRNKQSYLITRTKSFIYLAWSKIFRGFYGKFCLIFIYRVHIRWQFGCLTLWMLTSLSCWSKAKLKSSCNFEEQPYFACTFMQMLKSLLKSIVSSKYFESLQALIPPSQRLSI